MLSKDPRTVTQDQDSDLPQDSTIATTLDNDDDGWTDCEDEDDDGWEEEPSINRRNHNESDEQKEHADASSNGIHVKHRGNEIEAEIHVEPIVAEATAATTNSNVIPNTQEDSSLRRPYGRTERSCRRTKSKSKLASRWVHWYLCWIRIMATDTAKHVAAKAAAAASSQSERLLTASKGNNHSDCRNAKSCPDATTKNTNHPSGAYAAHSEAKTGGVWSTTANNKSDRTVIMMREKKAIVVDQTKLAAGIVVSAVDYHSKHAAKKVRSWNRKNQPWKRTKQCGRNLFKA